MVSANTVSHPWLAPMDIDPKINLRTKDEERDNGFFLDEHAESNQSQVDHVMLLVYTTLQLIN